MDVKIEINGDLTFSLWLQGLEGARGNIQIDGTTATLTYTSVFKDGVGPWSDNPEDIIAAAEVIGPSPLVGTITGHTTGSILILFDDFVKQ